MCCSPVCVVPDPIRGEDNVLVLCEVFYPDGTPHETNTRAKLEALIDDKVRKEACLFGFEQASLLKTSLHFSVQLYTIGHVCLQCHLTQLHCNLCLTTQEQSYVSRHSGLCGGSYSVAMLLLCLQQTGTLYAPFISRYVGNDQALSTCWAKCSAKPLLFSMRGISKSTKGTF